MIQNDLKDRNNYFMITLWYDDDVIIVSQKKLHSFILVMGPKP